MNTASRCRAMLQWTFQRRGRLLTCQVTTGPRGRFTVSLIPHDDRAAGQVETFESGITALQRHAAIASALRTAGWLMASYGTASSAVARAA